MANHSERGTETILLTDDEPLVRNLIATLLNNQGYTVLAASNGSEALQVAQEHANDKIDLLLTDIVMPQMDGVQLSTEFRRLFPQAKIILMSGYAEESKLQRMMAEPNVEFIAKPFRPQVLTNKVREMLDR
ncbi:MAG TPA: response regulator [Dehalococcoidia bacterium]|nr:response regulator [Dehalococcoidia bacterium]